jgi:hypothetical protein
MGLDFKKIDGKGAANELGTDNSGSIDSYRDLFHCQCFTTALFVQHCLF